MKQAAFLFCLFLLYCSCKEKRQLNTQNPGNPFFSKASEYRDQGRRDSAFLYFNKARDFYLQNKDSVGAGVCLTNMALISTDSGDHFGGQEISLDALSYFDEANPVHHVYLLSNYNNLGIATYSLRQYPRAIEFYNKSLQFISDSAYARIVKNNIGNALRKAGEYKKAISTYESILGKEKETINRARILSNYAFVKWVANTDYNPESELKEALRNRIIGGDQWGQNSSYSQLSDYYLARVPDSARLYSLKMHQIARSLKSADDQLEALGKLIPLSGPEESKKYFNRYMFLQDSLDDARNSAKNQFALIRYETEKHKADNLSLLQKNTVRNVWLIMLGLLIVMGTSIGIFWYKRKKQQLDLEAEKAVKESQLKTSKKVHDVVANGLYRLMSEMENAEQINRDMILDHMENLYERSRDISYDDEAIGIRDNEFHGAVSNLLMSFARPETRVVIVGNTGEVWTGLNQEARNEVYYVLQELMVNMTKHSNASSAAIRFERIADQIKVHYTDNGIGMPQEQVFKNGLKNTGNRIRSIHGNITFGAGTTGGLHVQIEFPVSTTTPVRLGHVSPQ